MIEHVIQMSNHVRIGRMLDVIDTHGRQDCSDLTFGQSKMLFEVFELVHAPVTMSGGDVLFSSPAEVVTDDVHRQAVIAGMTLHIFSCAGASHTT